MRSKKWECENKWEGGEITRKHWMQFPEESSVFKADYDWILYSVMSESKGYCAWKGSLP